MRLTIAVFALIGTVVFAAGAQTTANQPAQTTPTIRTKSRLVIIDVGVRDAQGRPVTNLKASDFTLTDAGRPQTISHFEEFKTLPADQLARIPEAPKLDANVFTNYTPVPPGALNILLLDTLNTPVDDQLLCEPRR